MKTRAGFVSNSSSSSFVILGIQTTDKEVAEKAEKLHLYCDWVEGDDYFVIGTKIGRWSDGEDSLNSIDMVELASKSATLTQQLTQLDLKEPAVVKLFYGEMMT